MLMIPTKRHHGHKGLTIMTWNIYFGADLTPLINTTPEEVPEAVTEVFDQVVQTDFPARAKAIAKQICLADPDLIGLQEVALWTVQSAASTQIISFLKILLKELRRRGLYYGVIAVNKNFRNQLPSSTGDIVGLLDRDVILAKCHTPMMLSNIQEHHYQTNLVAPVGDEPFTILRGWSSVDIHLCHEKFRLVNTHLESESQDIRFAQAKELIKRAGDTNLPLVLIGDYNTNAEGTASPTYDMLIKKGFTDAWRVAGQGSGFTAAQARDLLNKVSTLSERIDLILYNKGFCVCRINTIGNKQRNRTPNGLWPSDHAGVVATLIL